MDLDEIEALMQEPPGGDTYGRKATDRRPRTQPDRDGEAWSGSHRSLDRETQARVQYAATAGATVVGKGDLRYHGGTSDLLATDSHRTLTREELDGLDQSLVRSQALARLGFTEDDMALLDRPGTGNPDLRARFDEALLRVQESGGRMLDLARALGWRVVASPGRPSSCQRMQKALRRAREARLDPGRGKMPPEQRAAVGRKGACKTHRINLGLSCVCGQHAA